MKDTRPRWSGYESVKWYWRTPDGQPVYIVWAKDDTQLRHSFRWWMRWLPCPLLFHIKVWSLTH